MTPAQDFEVIRGIKVLLRRKSANEELKREEFKGSTNENKIFRAPVGNR